MSIDTVDMLEAAEDYAGELYAAARAVVEAWATLGGPAQPRDDSSSAMLITVERWTALGQAVDALAAATAEPFRRPGCEPEDDDPDPDTPCIHGEDCGGYHDWQDEPIDQRPDVGPPPPPRPLIEVLAEEGLT